MIVYPVFKCNKHCNISVCSFYADFGPLNLAMLYRYCCKLNKKLKVRKILLYALTVRLK